MKIQKLVSAISLADKINDLNRKISKNEHNKKSAENLNEGPQNIANLLAQFAVFFDVYTAIPSINAEHAVYISHAISILDDLGKIIKPEDSLYKAVLEILLFKQILTESLVSDISEENANNLQTCRVNYEHRRN